MGYTGDEIFVTGQFWSGWIKYQTILARETLGLTRELELDYILMFVRFPEWALPNFYSILSNTLDSRFNEASVPPLFSVLSGVFVNTYIQPHAVDI